MPKPASPRPRPSPPLPPEQRIGEAFGRLAEEGALQTLVRGALPTSVLKRLFRGAMPQRAAAEIPEELWSALAAGIAAESPVFGVPLAQALHDRLAWDREPASPEDWERAIRERPLEALWMAAISETKPVRKAFSRTAADCLRVFRASPACRPPSWEFVDGVLEIQAASMRQAREIEKRLEDAERRFEAERQRAEELREELKRLRRESSDLRAEKAQVDKRLAALEARAEVVPADMQRVEELERRLRKAEKENEHLLRVIEKSRAAAAGAPREEAPSSLSAEPDEEPAAPGEQPLSADPNPHHRVLRQILRKLVKKGKFGASHTHIDNVYRGLPDHEKGIAKDAMDLLAREDFLLVKPTATDPHVSLRPDRTVEIRAIIAGEIASPRLRRFVEQGE